MGKNCLQSNAGRIFSKNFEVNGEVTSLSSVLGCVWRLCQGYGGRVLGRVWGVVGSLGFCPGHLGPLQAHVGLRKGLHAAMLGHLGGFVRANSRLCRVCLGLMKDYERILGKLCDE